MATVHFPDVTHDLLLTAVFGGVFIGAGIGLAVRGGAVLDGTEIAALLIGKRSPVLKVGDVILGFNIVLFLVAMTVLGIEPALYSILTYVAAARTLDFILHGIEEFTAITIMSAAPHADPRRDPRRDRPRRDGLQGARRQERRRPRDSLLRRDAARDRPRACASSTASTRPRSSCSTRWPTCAAASCTGTRCRRLLDHCLQRRDHLGLVRGQREVAGVFDDDQALLRSRDLAEIRLHERRRREEIVPALDDVVGNLEAGRGGGKVRRHRRFNQGRARRAHPVADRLERRLGLAVGAVHVLQAGEPGRVRRHSCAGGSGARSRSTV